MKKIIFWFVGIGILILLIVGFIQKQSKIKSNGTQDVIVIEAVLGHAFNKEEFGALVNNTSEAVIATQVSGNMSNILVQEGEKVKKGQLLASISSPELNAQYNNAQAQLKITQEQEKKARRKWDDFKPEEREQFKLEVEGAKALSDQVAAMISKSRIVAPFDGVISQTFVKNGDTVMSGEKILYVTGGGDEKEVSIDVPVNIAETLNIGDDVKIKSDTGTYDTKISAISPVVDSVTRKNLVKVSLPKNIEIQSGVFVNVEFSTEKVTGLNVPKESIVRQYNDAFIFVVIDGVANMKKIALLGEDENNVIIEGLSVGDMVVVSGAHKIRSGDNVNIIN